MPKTADNSRTTSRTASGTTLNTERGSVSLLAKEQVEENEKAALGMIDLDAAYGEELEPFDTRGYLFRKDNDGKCHLVGRLFTLKPDVPNLQAPSRTSEFCHACGWVVWNNQVLKKAWHIPGYLSSIDEKDRAVSRQLYGNNHGPRTCLLVLGKNMRERSTLFRGTWFQRTPLLQALRMA